MRLMRAIKGGSSSRRPSTPSSESDADLLANRELVASMCLPMHLVLEPSQVVHGALLGEGGFGTVFRCTLLGSPRETPRPLRTLVNETVAKRAEQLRGEACVKVAPSARLFRQRDCAQLLRTEVSIWAALAPHPHIATFQGIAASHTALHLVCELFERGSVQARLERRRAREAPPPSHAELARQLVQIAAAMEHLHGLRPAVVHRDIKSANLLIHADGERLAVGDFGLARYVPLTTPGLDDGRAMTAETGSYRWMAPEVIRHEAYDERCDVYSFGITAWEMLTDRTPLEALTAVQMALGVATKGLRPPIPPSCPRATRQLLTTCWAQDPRDRPAFASLRRELAAAALAGAPVERRPGSAVAGAAAELRPESARSGSSQPCSTPREEEATGGDGWPASCVTSC